MNAITTTEREPHPLVLLQNDLEKRTQEFAKVLPAHITPAKFQRTLITAVQANPGLLTASRQSLILACMKAAQDGLLPDGREAALVEFNQRFKDEADGQWKSRRLVQYMPMVYGLRKKILQSGEISAIEVGVVYAAEVEQGAFYYRVGVEPPLGHKPMLNLTAEQADDSQIVAAYSIATMKDGTKSYEVMRRFEIDKVRETSQTGATKDRNGKPREPKGPWVDWFAEMAKKTVMRRHAKTLPMSGDIVDVEAVEDDRYSASALDALGRGTEDAPQLIGGPEDPPHDPVTGELTDDPQADNGADTDADKNNAENSESPSQDTDTDPDSERAETDELGVTKTEDEITADKIIDEVRAAGAVIDLNSIESKYRPELETMDAELAASVRKVIAARKEEVKAALAKAKAKEGVE